VRSLRGRLSLGVGALVAAVLSVSGVLISDYAERIARDGLDDRLRRTAELSRATAVDFVRNAIPGTDRRLDAVLRATGSSLRLLVGDAVVLEGGTALLAGTPPPLGLRTIQRDGEPIRVLVSPLKGAGLGNLAKLEVASSLADVERRQSELDTRLLRLGVAALLATALATWLAAAGVLRPLRRLRLAAHRIAGERDLAVRVPETDGPAEVRGMAASFNAMLERLDLSAQARERALEATRRFAFDAGHELRTPLTTVQATLSSLHRHPDVPAEQRTAMLADALSEQRRLVTLLDGLQALARGEAAAPDHEPVDLADVLGVVLADVRTRHPTVDIELAAPDDAVCVPGWEPGLRMLLGNLVGNAAHHGGRHVRVTLAASPARITVDDDGPGIPEADRGRIFEPFQRLDEAAGRPGSGLGLALVAQQARDHHATLLVEDSPLGGARVRVTFSPSS
jgi:two-component system sensor histidine kinase PrrB